MKVHSDVNNGYVTVNVYNISKPDYDKLINSFRSNFHLLSKRVYSVDILCYNAITVEFINY